MKKVLLAICALAMTMSVNAQEFVLKGKLNNVPEGQKLVLIPMSHDNEKPIAETKVKASGEYQFIAKAAFPRCVYLRGEKTYGGELIMVESGVNTTLNADVEITKAAWDGTTMYNFKNVEIINSPLTRKLKGYMQRRDDLDKLYSEYHDKYKEFNAALDEARKAKDQEKEKALWESEDGKGFTAAEKNFFDTAERTITQMIAENKDTYWGPLLALQNYSYFTSEQKPLWDSFSKEAQESWYGQKVKSEIFPGGGAGEQAKSIQMKGDDGKVVTLEQICKGKKYLLIDFWASWCGPCRKEIPNVKKQYAQYKDKGFEVLSISTDKDEKAWRKALDEEKLEWPNYRDVMGAADTYSVRAIPAMYLIDAQTKTIIASGDDARGEKLANKLAELLK